MRIHFIRSDIRNNKSVPFEIERVKVKGTTAKNGEVPISTNFDFTNISWCDDFMRTDKNPFSKLYF